MLGPRPSIDPSHQSLPVLEGTLVQDVPDGPVYLAFPMNTNQDIDSHRWLMRTRKYRVLIFGWVLLATAAIIAVAVVVSDNRNERSGSNDLSDPITTSTTSTTTVITMYTTEPEMNNAVS
jgi:hypothetical protein